MLVLEESTFMRSVNSSLGLSGSLGWSVSAVLVYIDPEFGGV